MSLTLRRLAVLGLVLVASVASCQDPTQITLVVRTNVPYRDKVTMAMWSSTSGRILPGTVPQVIYSEPWLSDGLLGDLVVTPGGSKDEPLTLRVVLGVGRDPAQCTDADSKGCIVARRKLSFVPHTRLRVPVVLWLACEGVVCSEDTTCNYVGKCVSAVVDPNACSSPEGCVLPGDPPGSGVSEAGPVDTGVPEAEAGDTAMPEAEAGDTGDASDTASPSDGGDAGVSSMPQLTAGRSHTCASFGDGTVKCWGQNGAGQLGLGDTQNRGAQPGQMGASLPMVDLGSGRRTIELTAGYSHTCALLDNGTVKCWGDNDSGELGLGDTMNRGDQPNEMGASLPAVDLGPGRTALQITAGAEHTCVRLDNGTVKCWGYNNSGQLGLGDTLRRGAQPGEIGTNLPVVDLGPGRTALQITAGQRHTCARLDNGAVKCWGYNLNGQLGLGNTRDYGDEALEMGVNLPFVDLGPGRTALQITAGDYHTCARLDNGTVKCWGYNNGGQLGLGDRQARGDQAGQMGANLLAVDLGPGRTALQITAGSEHTCARLDNSTVKCWGWNGSGQLGLGDTQSRGDQPGQMGASLPVVDLGPGRTALQITAGDSHTCARLDNGTVKCWGDNDMGELGLGDTQNRGDQPFEMGASLPVVLLQ